MTREQAAEILGRMYATAPEREKVAHIHLFGIRYAREIDGMPLYDLAEEAGLKRSFGTEIRKGMKLARYVVEKD